MEEEIGQDFTSRTYPMFAGILDDMAEEGHSEPGSEDIKSSVLNFEHPIFGALKSADNLNTMRQFANSLEPIVKGEVKVDTIKDMVMAAYNQKFPVEMLMSAADLIEPLAKRSGMGDASNLIGKLTEFANQMGGDKDPKNFEVFMAFAVDGADKAKQLLERAKNEPNKKARPIGSQFDDIIFFKPRSGQKVPRTNKEVVQFFVKRMMNGSDFFPHMPLGRDASAK